VVASAVEGVEGTEGGMEKAAGARLAAGAAVARMGKLAVMAEPKDFLMAGVAL
jgi:hypothetical protein